MDGFKKNLSVNLSQTFGSTLARSKKAGPNVSSSLQLIFVLQLYVLPGNCRLGYVL
jgi:hypothetical protein